MTREEAIERLDGIRGIFTREALDMAIEALTDAVEVVRCENCKYFEPDLMPIPYFEGDGVCCHEHWKLEDVGFEVKETDFCSYGERKEER